MKEAEERDRVEMRARLDVWDDDESDELFYTDRQVPVLAVIAHFGTDITTSEHAGAACARAVSQRKKPPTPSRARTRSARRRTCGRSRSSSSSGR